MSLPAAKVTYGREQAERVSVAVSAPSGATPSGTVTVWAGAAIICHRITLAAGQATCLVGETRLPAGTWHLTASYGGSGALGSAMSAARTLVRG